MTFLAGEDSGTVSQPEMESQQEKWDIDRFLENLSQEAVGTSCVDQENYPKILVDDRTTVVQPPASTQAPRAPLAEQGIAFQAALQQSHAELPHVRGGQAKYSKSQKIHRAGASSALTGNGNTDAQTRKSREKSKQKRKLQRRKERDKKENIQESRQTKGMLPNRQKS